MRESHVADEGTYAALALLRALGAHPGVRRLAVNWYRIEHDPPVLSTPARGHLDDPDGWRALDPPLLDCLTTLCADRGGSIAGLEGSGLLPPETLWFGDPLPEGRGGRPAWHRRALEATAAADVVFLAPDDGLELPVFPIAARRDRRTVAFDAELGDYLGRGQAVVCRQQRPSTTWPQAMRALRPRLAILPGAPAAAAVKLGEHGFLLLAPGGPARERLVAAARTLLARAAAAGWTHLPMVVHEGPGLTLAQASAHHHPAHDAPAVESAVAVDPDLDDDDRLLLIEIYRRLRRPPPSAGA